MSAQEAEQAPEPELKVCARCKVRPRRPGQHWCLECHAEYARTHPRSRYKDDPVKVAARSAVRDALAAGRLIKGACEQDSDDCKGQVQGHHDDYGAPLVVRWLCRRHHLRIHARLREEAKAG